MHSPECTHYDNVPVYSLNSPIDGKKSNNSLKSLSSKAGLSLLC